MEGKCSGEVEANKVGFAAKWLGFMLSVFGSRKSAVRDALVVLSKGKRPELPVLQRYRERPRAIRGTSLKELLGKALLEGPSRKIKKDPADVVNVRAMHAS